MQAEVWLFIVGLLLVVGYQMLTGKINTRGLLYDKGTGNLSASRVQLLVFTLAGALIYLVEVVNSGGPSVNPLDSEHIEVLLLIVGGSQALYLTDKAAKANILTKLFNKD